MKSLLSTLIFKVNNALLMWKASARLTDPTKDCQNLQLHRQHLLQIVVQQDIEWASPAQAGNDNTLCQWQMEDCCLTMPHVYPLPPMSLCMSIIYSNIHVSMAMVCYCQTISFWFLENLTVLNNSSHQIELCTTAFYIELFELLYSKRNVIVYSQTELIILDKLSLLLG